MKARRMRSVRYAANMAQKQKCMEGFDGETYKKDTNLKT
jgi:hypothetical protein